MSVAKIELTTPEGAPVQVETGVGRITAVIEKGTRNAQVHIAAEHLRDPVTGWVDRTTAAWAGVQWAHKNDAKIWYRVDLKRARKATEPIATPLKDLPRNSKVREFVRIELPQNAPGDETIGLDPALNEPSGRADGVGVGQSSSVGRPAATATDGHAPQGPTAPAAPAGPPPRREQPVTHPTTAHQQPPANPSPRPQSAPPIPGPPLTAAMLEALRDVVQAVQRGVEQAWRDDCCNSAVQAGCTREQVLHVLDRADRGLDVGLPANPTANPTAGQQPPQQQDAAARAVARQRDPDGLQQPRQPADAGPAVQGEAQRGPGQFTSPHNGMSRRVSARGNVGVDGKPYDVTNMDGSTNWASYAVDAVMDVVVLAAAQRMTRLRNLNHQDPERYELRNPTAREVDDLARTLLTMADRIQVYLRGGNRPDRMGASHKVARRALKEAIAVMAIPWGNNPAMAAWVEEVVSYGCVLVDVTRGIHERHPSLREQEQGQESAQEQQGGQVGRGHGAPDGQVPDGTGDTR